MANGNWSLTGNSGTNAPANFLGTTDNRPLAIKTNGTEAVRVDTNSNVGVGTTSPGGRLHVESGADFHSPQVVITQATPLDFARLQFRTFGIDPDHPGVLQPLPLWDIAAGRTNLNFFRQDTGNVMTLTSGKDPGATVLTARVGIATENPQTALHVNGTARVAVLEITGGGDLGESFEIEDEAQVEPGTVMVIDEQHPGKLKVSDRAYDRKVAGVVSGAGNVSAGLVLAKDLTPKHLIIALTGRIYCKAEARSGPIEPGDLLTTSSTPGRAMKANDSIMGRGAILGKAMTGLKEGEGFVLAIVNLQ